MKIPKKVLFLNLMVQGIRLKANPTQTQKKVLSQWMGCARYIWNAKTRLDKQLREELNSKETKEYPEVNASYAHLKSQEETPWLYDCPSVILRNSISNWRDTYQDFFKKRCGPPQHKKKDGRGSIYLTCCELFSFQKGEDGVTRLFVGSKKHNLGYLSIKTHKKFKTPNSIYIKKKHDHYWVCFCYEVPSEPMPTEKDHYKALSQKSKDYLLRHTVGIDRGVKRAVQTSLGEDHYYDLNALQERNKTAALPKEAIPTEKRKQQAL